MLPRAWTRDVTAVDRLTHWTGWDRRGGGSGVDGTAAFEHSPETDGEVRFELLAVAARGFRPPQFLTVRDLSADEDSDRSASDAGAHLRATWSLVYQEVAETAPEGVVPHAIYLLGVNPPEGVTDEELEVFNDFYTNVHLVEVAERRHALRAVRYELAREVKPPYQGAPRFLATYAVDEAGATNRRHVGPPYSSGPKVWQRHTTPWRLWYRRLTS